MVTAWTWGLKNSAQESTLKYLISDRVPPVAAMELTPQWEQYFPLVEGTEVITGSARAGTRMAASRKRLQMAEVIFLQRECFMGNHPF